MGQLLRNMITWPRPGLSTCYWLPGSSKEDVTSPNALLMCYKVKRYHFVHGGREELSLTQL